MCGTDGRGGSRARVALVREGRRTGRQEHSCSECSRLSSSWFFQRRDPSSLDLDEGAGAFGSVGRDSLLCLWSDLRRQLKTSCGDAHRGPAPLCCAGEWDETNHGSGCPERLCGLYPRRFSVSSWHKALNHRGDPHLGKKLDWRPLEVSFHLNYLVIMVTPVGTGCRRRGAQLTTAQEWPHWAQWLCCGSSAAIRSASSTSTLSQGLQSLALLPGSPRSG